MGFRLQSSLQRKTSWVRPTSNVSRSPIRHKVEKCKSGLADPKQIKGRTARDYTHGRGLSVASSTATTAKASAAAATEHKNGAGIAIT